MTDLENLLPEPEAPTPQHHERRRRRMVLLLLGAAGIVAVGAIAGTTILTAAPAHKAAPPAAATAAAHEVLAKTVTPAATYAAVIPDLIPVTSKNAPRELNSYAIGQDTPVYGADKTTPVAHLPALNFRNEPTTVVGSAPEHGWVLVLTPARQATPATGKPAAAQTAGWVRAADLSNQTPLTSSITVSVSAQTVTVHTQGQPDQVFKAGVGAPGTPTPTGVTGYIQSRYLSPDQGTGNQPQNMTSLHSATQDRPFAGAVGGVLAIHYSDNPAGDVSHGCIRLNAAGITAVNALPLGTPVTIIK